MRTNHSQSFSINANLMMSHTPSLFFLLLIFLRTSKTVAAASPPAYNATDLILLSCGESKNSNDISNRSWDGDETSKYPPSNAATISSASTASYKHPSVFPVPYDTARLFRSPFTYTFPVSAGQKFLRLYLYPDVYSGFDTSESLFSLTANSFNLLSNFSAFLYSKNTSQPSFIKEFAVSVGEDQRLDLTFTPNSNSFAFINGIEIVSMPDTLYFQGKDIKFADGVYDLKNDTALENLYRLNVGGARVDIQDDSGPTRGMFRAWSPDDDYIFGADFGYSPHLENVQIKYNVGTPPYSAPAIVYSTARVMANTSRSLEWIFPVDSGFYYLLRLHFCEFTLDVRAQNQRVFTVNINNKIANIQVDVILLAGGSEIPIFEDYITWVPNDGHRGKQDLRLSLFPNMDGNPEYHSALLNGLEIFKLSDSNRSLAAANPELAVESLPTPSAEMPPGKKRSQRSTLIYVATGSVISVLAVVAAIFLISRRWRKASDSITTSKSWVLLMPTPSRSTRTSGSGTSLPSNTCRYFSLDDIKTATRNFNDSFVIGKGGFGKVYKGLIDDCATTAAIKRLNTSSNQGVREFLTEIRMLSRLRHLNLVSLIGYCNDYGEMILVYDYMAQGTLRSHLYNSQNPPLTWKQRLKICIGAAKGLQYLHTGDSHPIIHRDVKTTNILLDEKWVAKLSDFGLSKVCPTGGDQTHVSTVVKGSSGYVDPEYYRRQQLTEKSDVYSFGVVLFEVLCGRPAVVPGLPRDQANLAEWAQFCCQEGTVEQIVDANLKGQITPECLNKFAETAAACVRDKGIERPAMNDVVWSLEFALRLQETSESKGGDGEDNTYMTVMRLHGAVKPSTTDEDMLSRSTQVQGSKSTDFSSGDVVSDMHHDPIGTLRPLEMV